MLSLPRSLRWSTQQDLVYCASLTPCTPTFLTEFILVKDSDLYTIHFSLSEGLKDLEGIVGGRS